MCLTLLLGAGGASALGTSAAVGFAGAGAMTGGAFFSGASTIGAFGASTAAASTFSLGTIFQAVSGIGEAMMSYSAAKAEQERLNYQAAVARNNSIIALQDKEDARLISQANQEEQRRRLNQTRGAAKVVMAANGLLVDEGPDSTSAALLADITEAGELDIQRIAAAGEREQRRFQIESDNALTQSNLFRQQASSISPAVSLLSSAGAIAAPLLKKSKGSASLTTPYLMS
tara:strand:- start:1897 stop:2586 length:690 start_codon:yes stop_codon:yes gene_type:complete